MITLAALLVLSAVAIAATVREVLRDGYRPAADRFPWRTRTTPPLAGSDGAVGGADAR